VELFKKNQNNANKLKTKFLDYYWIKYMTNPNVDCLNFSNNKLGV